MPSALVVFLAGLPRPLLQSRNLPQHLLLLQDALPLQHRHKRRDLIGVGDGEVLEGHQLAGLLLLGHDSLSYSARTGRGTPWPVARLLPPSRQKMKDPAFPQSRVVSCYPRRSSRPSVQRPAGCTDAPTSARYQGRRSEDDDIGAHRSPAGQTWSEYPSAGWISSTRRTW